MSIRIASWNVAGGLDDDQKAPQLVEGIKRLDADVLILCEACGENDISDKVEGFATKLGYTAVLNIPYENEVPHDVHLFRDNANMTAMSRLPDSRLKITRLTIRNAISMGITDPDNHVTINGFGTHLEDRKEDLRHTMAESIIDQMNPNEPSFVIGDLNSMHGEDIKARLLRSNIARWAAKRLVPTARIESLSTRLTEMADGDTLRILGSIGLHDVDHEHQPTMTMARRLPIVQLDHLLINKHILATDFKTHTSKASDHKAISAILHAL